MGKISTIVLLFGCFWIVSGAFLPAHNFEHDLKELSKKLPHPHWSIRPRPPHHHPHHHSDSSESDSHSSESDESKERPPVHPGKPTRPSKPTKPTRPTPPIEPTPPSTDPIGKFFIYCNYKREC